MCQTCQVTAAVFSDGGAIAGEGDIGRVAAEGEHMAGMDLRCSIALHHRRQLRAWRHDVL
jgi:hypothetical protein